MATTTLIREVLIMNAQERASLQSHCNESVYIERINEDGKHVEEWRQLKGAEPGYVIFLGSHMELVGEKSSAIIRILSSEGDVLYDNRAVSADYKAKTEQERLKCLVRSVELDPEKKIGNVTRNISLSSDELCELVNRKENREFINRIV